MNSDIRDSQTATSTTLPMLNPEETFSDTQGCCGLGGCQIRRALWGLTAAVVFFGVSTIAALLWYVNQSSQTAANNWQIPSLIDASAAVSSEKFSVATGLIYEDAEAFFVLDHNSGLLQCSVIYPRIGKFSGLFSVNVTEALGTGGKGGGYLMVTGSAAFPASSNRPIASTLVYVLNTATGNYAAYGIPFDRTAVNANRPQQSPMFLVGTGQANPIVDRESLR